MRIGVLGAGAWGAVVALMMPWFGRLFDRSDYTFAFRMAATFPFAGYALWRGLSAITARRAAGPC